VRALVVALVLLAAVPATAAARGCTGGTIYVNKGLDQLRVGNTRQQVVDVLGRPYYENRNGYMQYAPGDGPTLCDVYRTSGSKRSTVREFSFSGRRFVVSGGIRIFDNGGLRKLKARYPRMKLVSDPESGEQYYEILGRYHGRKVFTSISPVRPSLDSRAQQVFIGFR
jgi:SmpA/OmlA family protein